MKMTTAQLPGADPVFRPRTIERSPLLRYSVAIGAAGAALLIRLALNPVWADRLPFITFFPAIVLSAWYGGLRPGLLTTGLSAAAVLFYWLEPAGSLTGSDAADWLGLAVFVAIGAVISALNESLRTYAADRARLHETALEAQRQTEIAREQLNVALEAGGLGTWEYSLRTGVVTWSAGLEAIHGYQPGTFAGTFDAFRNEIFPADRDRVLQAIERAVAERRPHHVEYRIVRLDGAV
jgi:PAS domain-containing protein